MALRYSATRALSRSMTCRHLLVFQFRSLLFTASTLLPSTATISRPYNPSLRHHRRNSTSVCLIGSPLSFRKSAMVLKSGRKFSSSHIASRFRPHSRSSFRDERTLFRCPQMYNPSSKRGSYPGRPVSAASPRKNPSWRKSSVATKAAITRTGFPSSMYSSSVLGKSMCWLRSLPLMYPISHSPPFALCLKRSAPSYSFAALLCFSFVFRSIALTSSLSLPLSVFDLLDSFHTVSLARCRAVHCDFLTVLTVWSGPSGRGKKPFKTVQVLECALTPG